MSLMEKSVKSLESPYIANEVFQVPQQILCCLMRFKFHSLTRQQGERMTVYMAECNADQGLLIWKHLGRQVMSNVHLSLLMPEVK